MHLHPSQCILYFLALFGAVHGLGGIPSNDADCTVQAWVRAPDLSPNTIIQGDARVKISTACPAVEAALLGLRFKERSFIKALRSEEDRKRLTPAQRARVDVEGTSPWAFPLSRFDNRSEEIALHEMLANKDLWVIREEERIVFETTQDIHMVEGASGGYDVVQEFAVLVPSTNFPPAQDYLNAVLKNDGRNAEIIDAESMNEYFIRASFANGTTEDISAGFTGFEPLYDPVDTPSPEALEFRFTPITFSPDDSPIANYTAQISSTRGLVFTEGFEDQFATLVVTRTGPARTFSGPLRVRACIEPSFSSRWAAEHGMAHSQPWHMSAFVLRSTLKDVQDAKTNFWKHPCVGFHGAATATITMPNSTAEEIQSHGIVTTTSAPVTVPVKVDPRHVPNFETYYQTLANSLLVTLEMPRAKDETVDPDKPSAKTPSSWEPVFEHDEEAWVPWEKQRTTMPQPSAWRAYKGNVPVVVRPVGEVVPSRDCVHVSAGLSGQVVLSDSNENGCERPSPTHYLDEGARGPLFVDRGTVQQLFAEDPAERALRAPALEPVVSSPAAGEELVYRYYRRLDPRKPLIYVGETWAKRVAN